MVSLLWDRKFEVVVVGLVVSGVARVWEPANCRYSGRARFWRCGLCSRPRAVGGRVKRRGLLMLEEVVRRRRRGL